MKSMLSGELVYVKDATFSQWSHGDVIASRAYNDIVSSHIMLLTEYLFTVCGHMCNTVGLESCVIKISGKSRNV